MNGGTLIDTKSTFKNNAALRGGVFYCDGCDLKSYGSTYENNKAVMGGAIYLTGDANLVLEGVTATQQQAYALGGFLYVDGTGGEDIEVYIRDYVDGGVTTQSTITNTQQVTPSTHTYAFDTDFGGGIYVDGTETDLYFTNVLF